MPCQCETPFISARVSRIQCDVNHSLARPLPSRRTAEQRRPPSAWPQEMSLEQPSRGSRVSVFLTERSAAHYEKQINLICVTASRIWRERKISHIRGTMWATARPIHLPLLRRTLIILYDIQFTRALYAKCCTCVIYNPTHRRLPSITQCLSHTKHILMYSEPHFNAQIHTQTTIYRTNTLPIHTFMHKYTLQPQFTALMHSQTTLPLSNTYSSHNLPH